MGKKKKALLVIDIQNDFVGNNAKMPIDKNQESKMIENINRLIDSSLDKNLTVVYIGNEYSKYDFLNIFRNFAAIKNTHGAKQDVRLHLINDNYFPKRKGNSFSNPDLDIFLKYEQIKEISICGLMAEHCILATVKGAIEHQYNVTVLTDCIATKSDRKLLKAIEKYKDLQIKTMTSEEIY
jgi:nicotinamidase-related amidase